MLRDVMCQPQRQTPQLTVCGLVFAVVLAASIAAAIVCPGLLVGTSISSAIPSAGGSMAVLRTRGRRHPGTGSYRPAAPLARELASELIVTQPDSARLPSASFFWP